MVRDDIREYSPDAHHSEEEGKKIRAKIWKVTALLSIITIIEVVVGIFMGKASVDVYSIKWKSIVAFYLILTIVKAGYIVMSFMHLGDERKTFRWAILGPYLIFILYIIYIIITEGSMLHDSGAAL